MTIVKTPLEAPINTNITSVASQVAAHIPQAKATLDTFIGTVNNTLAFAGTFQVPTLFIAEDKIGPSSLADVFVFSNRRTRIYFAFKPLGLKKKDLDDLKEFFENAKKEKKRIKPDNKDLLKKLEKIFIYPKAELIQLREIAKDLNYQKRLREKGLTIEGFTDDRGTLEVNEAAGKRRAELVKLLLVELYRVKPERLKTKGIGETNPLRPPAPHQGPEATILQTFERRIELVPFTMKKS